jgi:hypothetical protein
MKPSKVIAAAFAITLSGLTHTSTHATELQTWILDAVISNSSSSAILNAAEIGQHVRIEYDVATNTPQTIDTQVTELPGAPAPIPSSISVSTSTFNNPIQSLTIDGFLLSPQSSRVLENDLGGSLALGVEVNPTKVLGEQITGIYFIRSETFVSFSSNVSDTLKKMQGSFFGPNDYLLFTFGSSNDFTFISAKVVSFAPVPEASSFSLMLVGLVAVLGATRRKSVAVGA